MAQLIASRGTIIDTEKCRALAGNNQFDLVLVAAQRMRELKSRERSKGANGVYITAVDALLEIQAGQLKPEDYLGKVK
jgi:DNA-directed RNA polymerase subunit K/omega